MLPKNFTTMFLAFGTALIAVEWARKNTPLKNIIGA